MLFYVGFLTSIFAVIYFSKIINSTNFPHFGLQIITLMLIALATFRYEVGVDYVTYFEMVRDFKLLAILRTEPFNQGIFFLSAYVESPFLCFFIYACITYIFVYKACVNNSISPYFSLLIYITFFYLESLGFIRQAVAMSIGLYAFKYIKQQKYVKYILWIIVCMMFHLSAIILMVVYPLYWKCRLKHALIGIVCIMALKSVIFYAITAMNFYTGYLEIELGGGGKLKYLYPLILLFLAAISRWKFSLEVERLFVISLIAIPFPFIFSPHVGMRISNYFFYYICYLIPLVYKEKKNVDKIAMSLIVSLVFFIYIGVSSYYVPYLWYWNR